MDQPYNLAALSPDEKDQLLTQLLAAHEGGGSSSASDSPAAPEAAPEGGDLSQTVGALLNVVEILVNVVEQQSEELAMLKKTLMDDLIGGIETLYNGNQKASKIDGLRGKYGSLFEPHMGALKEISPDEDIFDKLHELIESASGTEGWDDSKESDMATQLAAAIGDKIAKIKGPAPEVNTENPDASVKVTEVSASPEGADPVLMERIKNMKERNKAMGK